MYTNDFNLGASSSSAAASAARRHGLPLKCLVEGLLVCAGAGAGAGAGAACEEALLKRCFLLLRSHCWCRSRLCAWCYRINIKLFILFNNFVVLYFVFPLLGRYK